MRLKFLVIPAFVVAIGLLAWVVLAAQTGSAAGPAHYQYPMQAPATSVTSAGNAGDNASQEPASATASSPSATLDAETLPNLGKVVTDANGWILYRFDKDTAKPPASNCVGACAEKWPPVLTGSAPTLNGVDPSLVGTIQRPDGTEQVTLAGWPLYRYAGDEQPGQWKGQGVQGAWFVVGPNGSKNLTSPQKAAQTPTSETPAQGDGGYGY